MSDLKNTKYLVAPNGRYAIYARERVGEPWVQVESVYGEKSAREYATDLDENKGNRKEVISDMTDEEWDEDEKAPEPPKD